MIKSNEIVIGSQFKVGEEYVKVDEVLDACVSLQGREFTTFLGTLEPIPITKELLLKNGFIEVPLSYNKYMFDYEKDIDDFSLSFMSDFSNMPDRVWYLRVGNNKGLSFGGCDVQYVHQAQALMAIFGVELEFNFD